MNAHEICETLFGFVEPKSHALLFDPRINDTAMIALNVYQVGRAAVSALLFHRAASCDEGILKRVSAPLPDLGGGDNEVSRLCAIAGPRGATVFQRGFFLPRPASNDGTHALLR